MPDRRQDFLPRFNSHAHSSELLHTRSSQPHDSSPATSSRGCPSLRPPMTYLRAGPLAASVVSLWATRPWARVPWTWLTRAATGPRCSRTPPRPWPTLPKVGGPHGAHGSTCWRESVLDLARVSEDHGVRAAAV